MIDIDDIRALGKAGKLLITEHARIRLLERKIKVNDVMACIDSGEIIAQYEGDKPFPSCLILGAAADGRHIHAVLSHDGQWIYLITAYYPDKDNWESDFKTRKERF